MPETDTIPVSASVASTGPGIRYLGDWAYAYSGAITCGGSASSAATSYLNFTSGAGIIVAKINWINSQTSGTADNFIQVNLNDISVFQGQMQTGASSNHTNPKTLHMVIPPLTKFEFLFDTSADPHINTVVFTGRVYGAV
jgi:hypothetical protein